MGNLEIEQVPVLRDNYTYVVRHRATNMCAIIDPGASNPVMETLDRLRWTPRYILITHSHPDQIGGVIGLRKRFELRVIAPEGDASNIPDIDVQVRDGHSFKIGDAQGRVIGVPGHTESHVAYWFPGAKALFSGDSLMALGCGRVHEGTPKTMWNSLLKLRELPPETTIYCAHEHTQTNLQFARAMDPDNEALQKRGEQIMQKRQLNLPTVPSLLSDEIATNPFLRADVEEIQRAVKLDGDAPPSKVFGRLRKRRDEY